jgi:hypothetical protein
MSPIARPWDNVHTGRPPQLLKDLITYYFGWNEKSLQFPPLGIGASAGSSVPNLEFHDNNNSKSSRVRFRTTLLSALIIASAKSRLAFCSSSTFSSTVSRAISR